MSQTRTLTLTDAEYVALIWGLQLGLASAMENPERSVEHLRTALLHLNQKVLKQAGPLSDLDFLAAVRRMAD